MFDSVNRKGPFFYRSFNFDSVNSKKFGNSVSPKMEKNNRSFDIKQFICFVFTPMHKGILRAGDEKHQKTIMFQFVIVVSDSATK